MSEFDWAADILDVSAAQGPNIDWDKVAEAEVFPGTGRRWSGVIQKVAENETWKDATRQRNIAEARRVGMAFGVYSFVHPMGDVDAQVKNAYDAIGDTMPGYGFMFDFEAADPSLTPAQLRDQILRGRDASWKWFGALRMRLYTYPWFWNSRVCGDQLAGSPALETAKPAFEVIKELPLALATYGQGTPWYPRREDLPKPLIPWSKVTVWQYSGNTKKTGGWAGQVDGIPGDVDRNVFVGTEDEYLHDFMGRPRGEQLMKEPEIIHPEVPLIDREPREV